MLNQGTQSQDILFLKYTYPRCQSSLPQSEGSRHHRGPRRRGPLQRYRTGRTRCYFQSPPSRYAARSSPGWTGRGSASALQEETNTGDRYKDAADVHGELFKAFFFFLSSISPLCIFRCEDVTFLRLFLVACLFFVRDSFGGRLFLL